MMQKELQEGEQAGVVEALVSTCCCLIWEHNNLPDGLLQGDCQTRHLLPCQLPRWCSLLDRYCREITHY